MALQVIVDTDILIDFGKDKSDAVQTMANLEQNYDISVSVIIAMELYTGCRSKKDLKKVDEFLSDFWDVFCYKSYFRKSIRMDEKIPVQSRS